MSHHYFSKSKIEIFLRLDDDMPACALMRARAIYMIGLAFIIMQFVNQIILTLLYKEITDLHVISALAIFVVCSIVIALRYSKKFSFFAIAYMMLIIGGITAMAVPDGTGINSSLLPSLIAGTLMAGFISNWKMVLAYCFLLFALFGIYIQSR